MLKLRSLPALTKVHYNFEYIVEEEDNKDEQTLSHPLDISPF
jgi:hypothetical protein